MPEVTREFRIRAGAFELLAGAGEEPAPDPAALRAAPLEKTAEAYAVHASWVRDYAERGLQPPAAYVLSVRVKSRAAGPGVTLALGCAMSFAQRNTSRPTHRLSWRP